MRKIKQREIYMCDLEGIDSEYQGVHPCLILTVDIKNKACPSVIIVVLTHQDKKMQPTHHYLYKEDYNFFLYPKNTVLCEEIRTISKNRLERKIGTISDGDFKRILEKLTYNFKFVPYKYQDRS